MIAQPMDVLNQYPIRKSKAQKQEFRVGVEHYLRSLGYTTAQEQGSGGTVNLVAGDPERAGYLVTAHYDTCAALPFPNLVTPCNIFMFILMQLVLTVAMIALVFAIRLLAGEIVRNESLAASTSLVFIWTLLILMMAGPANKSNANDNTSGVVKVLEMARRFPVAYRNQVCFVLFDMEEAGLLGSAAYRKTHKAASKNQLVLNLDCVGDGKDILLFPGKKVKKNPGLMARLRRSQTQEGDRRLILWEKASIYPSDQMNFPYGIGVAALNKGKTLGYYCSRIHTSKDTILEEENVHILCRQLTELICGTAEKKGNEE